MAANGPGTLADGCSTETAAMQGAFDNSYQAAFGESGWGAKAQERLGQVTPLAGLPASMCGATW